VKRQATIFFCCLSLVIKVRSQEKEADRHLNGTDSSKVIWVNAIPDSSSVKGLLLRSVCKKFSIIYPQYQVVEAIIKAPSQEIVILPTPPPTSRHPLLTVKGNILYDVNYRSRIDTPYAENNIYQHTIQARLDFVYKEQYPFKIYLTTRFSNSNLFRKYTDLSLRYLQSDFSRIVKNKVIAAVETYILSQTRELDSLKRVIDQKKASLLSLDQSLHKTNLTQKLVEERERELLTRNSQKPGASQLLSEAGILEPPLSLSSKYKFLGSSRADTGTTKGNKNEESKANEYDKIKDSIESKKRRLDSLLAELQQLESLYAKLKAAKQLNLGQSIKEIDAAKDANTLTQRLHELKMPDTLLPKGYKTLYSIQSFSIGRSMANYSELSVKNISITGVQVEYNPRYYYALAAGKVDYMFRDYIVPNAPRSHQYLALARFGKGTRNGNHIIFTYYTGKRQLFNSSIAYQPNNPIPEYNLAGFTIEGLYKLSRNISIIGEVAKSTIPYYSLDSLQRKSWMNSVSWFKERSNEAYSVKLNSYFPKTRTRITGNLKYIGANFQSFSTFTTGASQTQWLARVEQPFFKNKLSIVSSVQQYDYSNPFVATNYKTSAILESIQATLRLRKWPSLSLGYYPSYQLTKINDNSYSESRYYTLVANASYYYKVHSVQLSSYIIYSQFYNQAADSGFVYFNSKNFLVSQSAVVNRLSLLLNASISINTGYNIYTLENNDQFTINKFLTAGGGLKMIRYSLTNYLQWGWSGNFIFRIPKLGDIQLMYDK
jgi:hypothetical protein